MTEAHTDPETEALATTLLARFAESQALIDQAAEAWRATATPDELAAFNLFRDTGGCPSCGKNASPGCACWAVRMPEFVAMVGGET